MSFLGSFSGLTSLVGVESKDKNQQKRTNKQTKQAEVSARERYVDEQWEKLSELRSLVCVVGSLLY